MLAKERRSAAKRPLCNAPDESSSAGAGGSSSKAGAPSGTEAPASPIRGAAATGSKAGGNPLGGKLRRHHLLFGVTHIALCIS